MKSDLKIRAATSADAPLLLDLIKELAEYERLSHEMTATPESVHRWVLGPQKIADAIIAEVDGRAAGYAIFFPYLSTFRGGPGMYLEDIYVRPSFRGKGVGLALMQRAAEAAVKAGCAKLKWVVLDWNQSAIDFYRQIGARPDAAGWTTYCLDDHGLAAMAAHQV